MRVLLAMILVLGGVAGVLFGGSGEISLSGTHPTPTPPANSNVNYNSNSEYNGNVEYNANVNSNWNMNVNMNMSNTNADNANR